MSIPARPTGQDPQSYWLWYVVKQLEDLKKITYSSSVEANNPSDVKVINSVSEPIPVKGEITSLPSGLATSANQTTSNNKLDTIITNSDVSKGGGVIDSKTQRVVISSDQVVPISPRPNTTGVNGTNTYKLISTVSTNSNVVKNSPGNLYSIIAIGLTSTVRYLKLYNKATTPVVGTDVPVMTIPIPANTQGAGVAIPFSMGVNFSNGISIAITANVDDNDNTAIDEKDCVINLTYA